MTEEQASKIVDELFRAQVKSLNERGDRPCKHLTLRASHLPCPHPDCSGTQPFLYVPTLPPLTYSLWLQPPIDTVPTTKAWTNEIWERRQLHLELGLRRLGLATCLASERPLRSGRSSVDRS